MNYRGLPSLAAYLLPVVAFAQSPAANSPAVVPTVTAISTAQLPAIHLPDNRIAEVYRGNWVNTLGPCEGAAPVRAPAGSPHAEPRRPWRVDVSGHYAGWYPGVDVKHMAAAYLACEKNLPLVLKAWELTSSHYLMKDGGVQPSTMHDNPQNAWPETTADGSVVYYPLRTTAAIDYLLLGDLIFRYSQDKIWLAENMPLLRRTAAFLEAWMDDEGLLFSDSYDLDQVYREIDGVAQASTFLAFQKLAGLEVALGETAKSAHATAVAARLAAAANKYFWDATLGYYVEHLIYNNVARAQRLGAVAAVSSELAPTGVAVHAIDGVMGMGVEAFGVHTGSAGKHEWITQHESVGAWIQIKLQQPTRISRVILYNRTDPQTQPGERFAAGYLEFSDGSPRVAVTFNSIDTSRAVIAFSPREVSWVKFTGTQMQGTGGTSAGLAEFIVLPSEEPYRKVSHGMTDSSFAMVAFQVADDTRATKVWNYFKAHEAAFYAVDELHAPTWIAEKPATYSNAELNRRAPRKDCVAMGRTWRYDVLMRQRMHDGDGIYQTLQYACALYDRPSGGGAGYFGERYGLGRFQPGDLAQGSIPKYSEYPAVFNSTVVQQALLGIDADITGAIIVAPCVPRAWYEVGFGQDGCGVRHDRNFGFTYHADRIEGWLSGTAGAQQLRLKLPPSLIGQPIAVQSNGHPVSPKLAGGFIILDIALTADAKSSFAVSRSAP